MVVKKVDALIVVKKVDALEKKFKAEVRSLKPTIDELFNTIQQ